MTRSHRHFSQFVTNLEVHISERSFSVHKFGRSLIVPMDHRPTKGEIKRYFIQRKEDDEYIDFTFVED